MELCEAQWQTRKRKVVSEKIDGAAAVREGQSCGGGERNPRRVFLGGREDDE